jgi:hypothetical protein
MTSYHLVPDGRTWRVKTEFGSIVSQGHRTKAGARRAMERAASPGDSKYIHGSDGAIQKELTHRG